MPRLPCQREEQFKYSQHTRRQRRRLMQYVARKVIEHAKAHRTSQGRHHCGRPNQEAVVLSLRANRVHQPHRDNGHRRAARPWTAQHGQLRNPRGQKVSSAQQYQHPGKQRIDPFHRAGSSYGAAYGRAPKIAVPTLTQVEPSSIATSKSCDIPIESSSRFSPLSALNWSRNSRKLRKHPRAPSGSSVYGGTVINPRIVSIVSLAWASSSAGRSFDSGFSPDLASSPPTLTS